MEYYIYSVPVFLLGDIAPAVDIPAFCAEAEDYLPASTLNGVDVIYIGDFKDLNGRNATYSNGAIYMSASELTTHDYMENFIHEVAHSLEPRYGLNLYDDEFLNEFLGKRRRMKSLLQARGYNIPARFYELTEYNAKFDRFLADEVGYPTLLSLTMGLFVSPYGATSVQEYFANGFEKYFLDNPKRVRDISPILYRKIEEILNDQE